MLWLVKEFSIFFRNFFSNINCNTVSEKFHLLYLLHSMLKRKSMNLNYFKRLKYFTKIWLAIYNLLSMTISPKKETDLSLKSFLLKMYNKPIDNDEEIQWKSVWWKKKYNYIFSTILLSFILQRFGWRTLSHLQAICLSDKTYAIILWGNMSNHMLCKAWFPPMRLIYSLKNKLFSFMRLTLGIIL